MTNADTSRGDRARARLLESALGWAMVRFGAPLVVGMMLHTLFNLIDMVMISRLPNGADALAALGISDMVAAVATILSSGLSTATVALISRAVGAKEPSSVRQTVSQSLMLVGFFSVVFGLLGVFGSDFMVRDVMHAKGAPADLASAYLQVMLGGCFSIFLLLQLTAILRGLGHSKSAAALLVGGNVLNIVLNVVLIYGTGPSPDVFAWGQTVAAAFDVPRMGVVGAAWATLIGRAVPVLLGLVWVRRCLQWPSDVGTDKDTARASTEHISTGSLWRPRWRDQWAILRIGWPSSAQMVLRVGGVLFVIALINAEFTTVADASALTAYSLCLRLETLALFIAMAWGAAASSFVGTNVGAGATGRAQRAGWVAMLYSVVMLLMLGVLYTRFGEPIFRFFDDTPSVLAVGQEYMTTVAFSYAFLGAGIVLSQAMTGAGATLSSLVLDVCLLGVTLPAAYVVTVTLNMPREALWRVVAVGNVATMVAYMLYYARGSFLHKQL